MEFALDSAKANLIYTRRTHKLGSQDHVLPGYHGALSIWFLARLAVYWNCPQPGIVTIF